MKIKTVPFKVWWKGIKSQPTDRRKEILGKWLHYACKTIANRGDHNQQKVVYTIATRYNKSKYKKLSKENARKVYALVNNKQLTHKRMMAQIRELQAQLEAARSTNRVPLGEPKVTGKNVVITRHKHRRIITGNNHHDR